MTTTQMQDYLKLRIHIARRRVQVLEGALTAFNNLPVPLDVIGAASILRAGADEELDNFIIIDRRKLQQGEQVIITANQTTPPAGRGVKHERKTEPEQAGEQAAVDQSSGGSGVPDLPRDLPF